VVDSGTRSQKLGELLIERGIFSRDELVERLHAVMSKDDA
jgi:hypothetical protein